MQSQEESTTNPLLQENAIITSVVFYYTMICSFLGAQWDCWQIKVQHGHQV